MAKKTLILVRHGKSDWGSPELADIDRPLKVRGVEDSLEMARRMKKKGLRPGLIVSSPATRALSTAIIFARELGIDMRSIWLNEDVYLVSPTDLMAIVKDFPDEMDTVMVFGHNPGFTEFVNYFARRSMDNLPTAGVAVFHFKTEKWSQVNRDMVEGEHIDYPKNK